MRPSINSVSSLVRLGTFAYNLPISNGVVFLKLPVDFPTGVHDVSVVDSGSEVFLKDALSCLKQVKIVAVSPSVAVVNNPTSVTISIDTAINGFFISTKRPYNGDDGSTLIPSGDAAKQGYVG